MGALRPVRRPLRSALIPLVPGLLLLGACDSGTSAADEKSPELAELEAKAAAAEAKLQANNEELARLEAERAKAAKAGEASAAQKRAAEEALAKAKAEQEEAKRKAAEQEIENRPVKLSDIAVKPMGGMFGGTGMLEVTAKATLNQELGNSTYVHIKSLCKKDDDLVADVGYLNAHYAKPLEQYAKGAVAEIKGTLYTQGLDAALKPCQFEFRVGGISGGLSIPVGDACWDGSEVALGKCEPILQPVAMSGVGQPVEVHTLGVERSGGLGGSKGLNLNYLLRVNAAQDSTVRLSFKAACRIGGKSFVDMGQANLMAGPFKYDAGETVARSANLYWSSAFELADAPNDCDLTTSLWKTKAGTFGEYEEVRLENACFKDDKLRDGRCDPSAPGPVAATPLAAESVTVDDVRLELVEPHGTAGAFQLKIQADVTVRKPVEQNDGATAKVSCKAGKENRVESAYLFGPELYYLQAGETARMTASAFGSDALKVKPKTCKVEFFGGPRFSPSGGDGVELGTFCLKKDKVKVGGKC